MLAENYDAFYLFGIYRFLYAFLFADAHDVKPYFFYSILKQDFFYEVNNDLIHFLILSTKLSVSSTGTVNLVEWNDRSRSWISAESMDADELMLEYQKKIQKIEKTSPNVATVYLDAQSPSVAKIGKCIIDDLYAVFIDDDLDNYCRKRFKTWDKRFEKWCK